MDNFLIFDIFTVNSFFQYETRKKVPSYPGLCFSLILYTFLVYSIIISDMVQKQNPKISDMIIADERRQSTYELSLNNFYPVISLVDDKGIFLQHIDPQIWHIMVFNEQSFNLSNSSNGFHCVGSSNFILKTNKPILIDIFPCVN